MFYIYDKIQSRECYEMRRRLKNKITTLVEIQYTLRVIQIRVLSHLRSGFVNF